MAHGSNGAYSEAVKIAQPWLLLENLTDQVFELAHISREKMAGLHAARGACWFGFWCWILAVVSGLILFEVEMSIKGPFDDDLLHGLLFGEARKPKSIVDTLFGTSGRDAPVPVIPPPGFASLIRPRPQLAPPVFSLLPPSLPRLTQPPNAIPPALGAEQCKKLVASLLRRRLTVGLGRVLPNLDTIAVMEGREIEAALVYTDLASFTKIVASQPSKTSFVMLQAFVELVTRITSHYGGAVVDCAGDRLLSVFHRPARDFSGQPVQQGITAAFWTQAMLAATAPTFLACGVSAPQVGIGIDYGSVVAGCVGYRNNKKLFFLGDAANNAAKLQDVAQAGETIMSYAAFLRKPSYMNSWTVDQQYHPVYGSIIRVNRYFAETGVPPKAE